MTKKNISIAVGASLLVTAIAFVTIFSYTTSPLYPAYGNTPDSPIFQIIGKYWAQGFIPYKDLWDMKGPFIFLVNALGFAMTHSKTGVYIIQIISLYFTLLSLFSLFRCHFSIKSSLLFTFLSLAGLSYIYNGGNLTEEYILFPLTLSFYYIMQWLHGYEKRGDVNHQPPHAIVYGIVLGISLMSRLTNALSICAAMAVIACMLLHHKAYKNLFINFLYFLLGFALITIPFFCYFYHHRVLTEMWNGTFVYAFHYASHSSNDILSKGIHYFFLSYFNSILLMLMIAWRIIRERKMSTRSALWLFAALVPFIWFCQGNGYGHYGMTVYPLFAVAMMEIHHLKIRYFYHVVTIILLIACASKVRFMYAMHHWKNENLMACQQFLRPLSNDIDYTSFVAYNCDPNLYLALDVRPAVPIFSLQEMGSSFIPVWNDFLNTLYKEKHPDWILVSYQNAPQIHIQGLLEKDYTLYTDDPQNQLKLYRRTVPEKE